MLKVFCKAFYQTSCASGNQVFSSELLFVVKLSLNQFKNAIPGKPSNSALSPWVLPCGPLSTFIVLLHLVALVTASSALPIKLAAIQGTYRNNFSTTFQMQNCDQEVRTTEHISSFSEREQVLLKVMICYDLYLRVWTEVIMGRKPVSYSGRTRLLRFADFFFFQRERERRRENTAEDNNIKVWVHMSVHNWELNKSYWALK